MANDYKALLREIIRDVNREARTRPTGILPDGSIEQEMIERYARQLGRMVEDDKRIAANRERLRHAVD